jgi:hypothetical protein
MLLDPMPLKHWTTGWSDNPIVLGKSNKGLADTGTVALSATFNFNLSTSLTLGVIEITFPTSFDVSTNLSATTSLGMMTSSATSQMVTVSGLTMSANTDQWIMVNYNSNPTTTGGYGPFKLTSRHHTNGQI